MTLEFNDNGLETSTFSEIFNGKVEEYKAIYGEDIDVDQESPDGQRIGIESMSLFDMESFVSWLYSQLDCDLNSGDMQQVIAKLAGVYMLPASRSQWDLIINMERSNSLPSGYTVTDKNNQNWFLDSDVAVSAGDNNVTFLAVEWGAISGSSLEPEFTQATPENYVNSITATADAVMGRTEETPEQFRVRRKKSVENPSQSTNGAIYAKLAGLPGVTDLQVYDNSTDVYDTEKDIKPHYMWVTIDGGSLDDIGEVMAKQRLGGTKGDVLTTYTDELTKPNGEPFFFVNEHYVDRPVLVDLYVRLTATKSATATIDIDAIKNSISSEIFYIGEQLQAAELCDNALIENYNYIVSDLEISLDGTNWTDKALSPNYGGKFTVSTDNITVTEVSL